MDATPQDHSEGRESTRGDVLSYASGPSFAMFHSLSQPLESKKAEIRLMHLLPGLFDDRIKCRLEVVSLDDKPEYEALSYCWGNPEISEAFPTFELSVNDSIIRILPNLSHALRYLRDPESTRTLWVDYICIDQSDTPERNSQVQLMGSIYREARRVVCWLGNGNVETRSAMKLLVDVVASDTHFGEFFAGECDDSIGQRAEALDRLLHRSWFYRIWTIQEVALSRDAILVCGDESIPWSMIHEANDFFQRHWYCCIYFVQSHEGVGKITNSLTVAAGRSMLNSGDLSLCDILVKCMENHATDNRDHVYGLLGLLNDSKSAIRVDYELSAEEVFRRTAIAIMRQEKNIDYLSKLFTSDGKAKVMSGLPSWVVDFSNLTHNNHGIVAGLFNACGSHEYANFNVIDDETISYTGLFVGKVTHVNVWQEHHNHVNTVHEALSLLQKLEQIEQLTQLHKDSICYSQASAGPATIEFSQPTSEPPSEAVHEKQSMNASSVDKMEMSTSMETPSIEHGAIDPRTINKSILSPLMSALYRTLSFGWLPDSSTTKRRLNSGDDQTYIAAREALSNFANSPIDTPASEFYAALSDSNVFQWGLRFMTTVCTMRFFITDAGHMGVGHKDTKVGDKVVILKGGHIPFLVRPLDSSLDKREVHTFLGPVYVDGIMDGEATEQSDENDSTSVSVAHDEKNIKTKEEWQDVKLV